MPRRQRPGVRVPAADHARDTEARAGIGVWLVDMTHATDALLALEAETPRLAANDHQRAAVQGGGDASHPRARERRAVYVALRLLLERAFGAQAVRGRAWLRSDLGRPSLPGLPGDFSLAHIPGHALIGVTRRGSIGVDIERRRTVRMAAARQEAIVRAAQALDPDLPLPAGPPTSPQPLPPDRLLAAWVRLEAFAKAQRVGMARVLTAAGALGGAGALRDRELRQRLCALGMTDPGGGGTAPAVRVCDLDVADGLFAAEVRVGDGELGEAAVGGNVRRLPATLDALRTITG